MKLIRSLFGGILLLGLWTGAAYPQAAQLPPGEQCFQANVGTNGFVGSFTLTASGTGGTSGTFGGVSLTGGSGSGATANIVVSGGGVTTVAILNPGTQYVVGDVLSASAGTIGGTTGFQITVNSVAINSAVAGGSVAYYIPSTLTPKQTWQDAAESIPNSNPVKLDQNGCAIVYGTGTYRQILQDSLGNTIWDQLTTASNGTGTPTFWGGTSTGSANAQIITAAGFTATDGQAVAFVAGFSNTSSVTLNANATGNIAVVKDTASGSLPLAGGEIVSGNVYQAYYVAGTNSYHIPVGATDPVGTVVDYTGASAPAGWLFANGACVSQSTYSALYAIIGATYGASCVGSTFALPDYRGRVSAGLDNMGGAGAAGRLTAATMTPNGTTLGAFGGIEGSAISIGQLPVITPSGTVTISFPGLSYTAPLATSSQTFALGGAVAWQQFTTQTLTTAGDGPTSFPLTLNSFGSGNTYYVVQPTLLVNKIIKF
jgi:microcystin-dependent protein